MVCSRVRLPEGVKLSGVTADGRPTTVLPGEYLAHLLPAKVPTCESLVRLVGADPSCRDVHLPLNVAKRFATIGASDAGRCSRDDVSEDALTQPA